MIRASHTSVKTMACVGKTLLSVPRLKCARLDISSAPITHVFKVMLYSANAQLQLIAINNCPSLQRPSWSITFGAQMEAHV